MEPDLKPMTSLNLTIPQGWEHYSAADHATWDHLFERQMSLLPGCVACEFLSGIELLGLDEPGIPHFERLSERLMKLTGWEVVAVPGLIPDKVFFDHLAHRRFVSGNFIRSRRELDYLQEPDVFHDVFGHVPLLAHPVFADFMQAFGQAGTRAASAAAIPNPSSLYWYTVEFGLMRDGDGLKIYGAGVASSYGEARFALESPSPNRVCFDLERVMRTQYRIDDFQQTYFVINSFEDLLAQTLNTDFAPLYTRLRRLPELAPTDLIDADIVITRGTQPASASPISSAKIR
ncbi:MAG TPA: phenylalanine 4-monooxygenase [Sphingomicrobium sp.]|nr:phenylalanine 4-monooxygenase [Sphingomicrobium sp.]